MVQEITGWRDNYIRRSGSMLPPPVDDFVDNESSARKIPKVVLNVSCSLFLEPLEIVSVVSIFHMPLYFMYDIFCFWFLSFFSPFFPIQNAHSVVKNSPPNDSNSQSVTLPAGALW